MSYRRTVSKKNDLHVLTNAQVNNIRASKIRRKNLYKQLSKISDKALAEIYDVSVSTIGRL